MEEMSQDERDVLNLGKPCLRAIYAQERPVGDSVSMSSRNSVAIKNESFVSLLNKQSKYEGYFELSRPKPPSEGNNAVNQTQSRGSEVCETETLLFKVNIFASKFEQQPVLVMLVADITHAIAC